MTVAQYARSKITALEIKIQALKDEKRRLQKLEKEYAGRITTYEEYCATRRNER